MRRSVEEIMNSYCADLPGKWSYRFLRLVARMIVWSRKPQYIYHFDTEKMQGRQVILLSDHSAADSYLYPIDGYPFTPLNFVVGYIHFYKIALHYGLKKTGCIPKRLYENDFHSVRQMLSVLKEGGSLCLFPEGIQSNSGSNHPIHPTTASFLKQAGITVVLCKGFGTYLTYPLYDLHHRQGHIEYHFEILFTPDELEQYTDDEIYRKLLDRFRYNDFEWNSQKKYKYLSKYSNGTGLQNLLYLCPQCGEKFTLSFDKEHLICKHCGNRIFIDSTYELQPVDGSVLPYRNIDEWFKVQRMAVREEIRHSKVICDYDCEVWGLYKDRLRFDPYCCYGKGHITIDDRGILYKGTYSGETVELFFDIRWVPSFFSHPGQSNELYYQGDFYLFKPIDEAQKAVYYDLLVEEYHNLIDEKWNRASRDAYDLSVRNI